MDIQIYFRKRREIENSIQSPFVVMYSLDTNDGGKQGLLMEVSRANAARLVIEQRARLANDEETKQFYEDAAKAREAAQQAQSARLPLAVLSEQEMRALRTSLRPHQKG